MSFSFGDSFWLGFWIKNICTAPSRELSLPFSISEVCSLLPDGPSFGWWCSLCDPGGATSYIPPPAHVCWCFVWFSRRENLLEQSAHSNIFMPVWRFLCLSMWSFRLNIRPHTSHAWPCGSLVLRGRCFCICNSNVSFLEKRLPQTSQANRRSCTWSFLCSCIAIIVTNFIWQTLHLYRICFLCTCCICLARVSERTNRWSHSSHANGFSPVCRFMWRDKWLRRPNIFPQYSHARNLLSAVTSGRLSFRPVSAKKWRPLEESRKCICGDSIISSKFMPSPSPLMPFSGSSLNVISWISIVTTLEFSSSGDVTKLVLPLNQKVDGGDDSSLLLLYAPVVRNNAAKCTQQFLSMTDSQWTYNQSVNDVGICGSYFR